MRRLESVAALEELGRLSRTFFMRDFLYSEIGNLYCVSNVPENPDLALGVASHYQGFPPCRR